MELMIIISVGISGFGFGLAVCAFIGMMKYPEADDCKNCPWNKKNTF